MQGAGPALPPAAWLALVARRPRLLQRGVVPRSIELTAEVTERLRFVQNDVNTSILYTRDPPGQDRWGVLGWRKIWGLAGRRWIHIGDCDDYAVEKMRRSLDLDLGLAGSLRLVTCHTWRENHLVLAVDGTSDTLILDNRRQGVWSWNAPTFERYRWLARSVPGRVAWERIRKPTTLEDLARRVT